MLNQEQLRFFEEEGYLVIEDVIDQKSVLDPVRQEYSELMDRLYDGWHVEGKVPAPDGMSFDDKLLTAYRAGCDWFQPMDISLPANEITNDTPFHFGPAVFNLLTCPSVLDIVQSLIGSEITSNPIQHVRIKPPAIDLRDGEARAHITKTEWHQDQGVTHESADKTNLITVWIAVSDAPEENGCLEVQPRGHLNGLIPHCNKTQIGIPDSLVDKDTAKALPVKSGGIILFHPLVPHGSRENHTDGFRWSFDIRYNVTDQPTGRDHFPAFVARSKSQPERVLTDPAKWLQSWEETRANLASDQHVPLYRWDDSAPYCA